MADFIKPINTSIQFTDMSTNSPTSWLWSFGDGTVSTVQNPTHTYTVAGTYTITETVSNSCGASPPITKTIQIQPVVMGGIPVEILGLGLLVGAIYLTFKKKREREKLTEA